MGYMEICGCIHLHTTFSDGGCDYPTLLKAAEDEGLDYVCITDHRTLDGRNEGWEGRCGHMFVLIGYEHNDRDNLNHYLAFGVDRTAEEGTEPQEYINRIKAMGGTGFLAHPAEKRAYIKALPPYPWTKWDADGFDGIEIWNQVSDWMEQLRGWHSFTRIFFPYRFIGNAPRDLLERWDDLNRRRFVSGIGGVDAHSRKFSYGPFSCVIFPIKVELRCLRTHLFVDVGDWDILEYDRTAKAIITAMRDGRGFISNFNRGDAYGSEIFLWNEKRGMIQYPGRQTEVLSLPMTMVVRLPHRARIVLLRNGQVVRSASGKKVEWPIDETGVYRVEVYKGSRAWIYSNPFPVGKYPIL